MSTRVHIVKVTGKSRDELIQGLKAAINELSTEKVSTRSVEVVTEDLTSEEVVEEEEMEEVPSKFAPTRIGEEDVEGVPWNSKFHASSKEKNQDGTWRAKRGVDKNALKEYKSEFVKTPAPVETPVIPSTPSVPSTPVVTQTAPTLPPMPSMNAGHTLETFIANFPVVVANLITEKKIDQNYINQLKDFFKVDEIWKASDEQKGMIFAQWTSPEWNLIQKVG